MSLMLREHHSNILVAVRYFDNLEVERLGMLKLGFITCMPVVCTHLAMMTTLIKRWHSETSSFHLSTSEATITLEDVWHFLRLSIQGECVIYDTDVGRDPCCSLLCMNNIILISSQIDLDLYHRRVPILRLFVVALIFGMISLD